MNHGAYDPDLLTFRCLNMAVLTLVISLIMPACGLDDLQAGGTIRGAISFPPDSKYQVDPTGRMAALWKFRRWFHIHDLQAGRIHDDFQDDRPRPLSDRSIHWSPDGNQFSYRAQEGNLALYLYDVATREVRTIRQNRIGAIWEHYWNPCGAKQLAILEQSANIFAAVRQVRILDVEPTSSQFGEVVHELRIERRMMPNGASEMLWFDPGMILVYEVFEGATDRHVVLLEVPSGRVLGQGVFPYNGGSDYGAWKYFSTATGREGAFEEVFGFPMPEWKGGHFGSDERDGPHDREVLRRLLE